MTTGNCENGASVPSPPTPEIVPASTLPANAEYGNGPDTPYRNAAADLIADANTRTFGADVMTSIKVTRHTIGAAALRETKLVREHGPWAYTAVRFFGALHVAVASGKFRLAVGIGIAAADVKFLGDWRELLDSAKWAATDGVPSGIWTGLDPQSGPDYVNTALDVALAAAILCAGSSDPGSPNASRSGRPAWSRQRSRPISGVPHLPEPDWDGARRPRAAGRYRERVRHYELISAPKNADDAARAHARQQSREATLAAEEKFDALINDPENAHAERERVEQLRAARVSARRDAATGDAELHREHRASRWRQTGWKRWVPFLRRVSVEADRAVEVLHAAAVTAYILESGYVTVASEKGILGSVRTFDDEHLAIGQYDSLALAAQRNGLMGMVSDSESEMRSAGQSAIQRTNQLMQALVEAQIAGELQPNALAAFLHAGPPVAEEGTDPEEADRVVAVWNTAREADRSRVPEVINHHLRALGFAEWDIQTAKAKRAAGRERSNEGSGTGRGT